MGVIRIIYLLALCLSLISCSNEPFFWDKECDVSIEIYKSGKEVNELKLTPESEIYTTLRQFINKGKWENTYTTYVPDIILRSKYFEINLWRDRVIVNYYNKKNNPIQSIWKPAGQELAALKKCREHILNILKQQQ